MKLGIIFSSLVYFVAILMQNQGCKGCLEKERIGLLEIKDYISSQKGDPYNELDSWVDNRASNCCTWNKVKCSNISSGHITDLSLQMLLGFWSSNTMLNVSLSHPFEELRLLDLSGNGFSGWIGNEGFPRLNKLDTLDLSDNNLNSSILRSLNELTSLTTLKLGYNLMQNFSAQGFLRSKELEVLELPGNMLNGSIIPSLHEFTSLKNLWLGENNIDCSLSSLDFTKFSRLELLDLYNNQLTGSLHLEDVQNLRNLKVLRLNNNYMNGSIEGLCKLKDLEELDINSNMFSAQLPECLSNLTNLQVLELSNNLFSGNFPSFTTNLTSLTYLSMYENYMQGTFSLSTLANHSKLQFLSISSKSIAADIETENTKWFPKFQLKSLILRNCNINMDKGSVIPNFLSYQYNLTLIDLSSNKLVGSFPSWLINSSIRYLDISNNNLSGLLPKDFGNFLPSVSYLNMSWNSFEGNIPSSIGKMKNLEYLDLSHNHFFGKLPTELATYCKMLTYMKVSNNYLQGNIPKFSNWMHMEVLFLNNNNFSGTLEDVLGNNTGLIVLSISNNSITGTIPNSIVMFSSMEVLLMENNLLEGEIPNEMFLNMSKLQIMDLSQNKLIGSLPKFNCLTSLRFLYLQKNYLSGSIPFELSKSSNLQLLDLRENKLYGKIPNWIDKFSELRVLLLGRNNFEGEIPIQLCQLKKVDILDLSRNVLNASIPSCFQNLSFGMRQYDDDGYGPVFEISLHNPLTDLFSYEEYLSYASLSIILPSLELFNDDLKLEVEFITKNIDYFYKGIVLENMTGLDLSCNKLTGIIPSQIGNMKKLKAMNLSHNYLSGPIPISFNNLTQIESLDLSFNNLCGKIPSQLTQLNFLSIFNVSYNNLSGTPPSIGQFGDFDDENYRGNPDLCGPLLKRKCEDVAYSPSSPSNENEENETKVDMIAFYWSFAASYITILLAILTVLYINVRWRMVLFYYVDKVILRCFPTFPLH